ncbi:MAG: RsmB/NOP family class I SAM-dependent RNA methyltransferase [Verrucomicrobia bacterium]|nr:RsmB/NOP family class I SAM-dependent RNA methyltransferase [Verrucomicrobiota bacterium]
MSDSVLLNRAALIIDQVSAEKPADYVLRGELGAAKHLLSSEKRDIAHAVFAYHRWFGWLDQSASTQIRLASALDLQRKYDADPASIKPESLTARAVPDWLKTEMEITPAYLRQLQRPSSLWIRVQREFAAALPRSLGHCTAPDLSVLPGLSTSGQPSTALRYSGSTDLFKTSEFQKGVFEIQDLASQLVGHACAPQPGETWWDTCAGEGGKTLHLADLMANKGLIWASDRNTGRLAALRKRAARAQVFNYRAVTWNGGPFLPTKTKFDGILVDAPCSGVGTWQRNPHARWTTTPTDVKELAEIQIQLLDNVANSLKPGGRLIYAVCTLTKSETTAIADKFTATHPGFEPAPVFGSLATADSRFFVWPQDFDANGMFIAAWKRKA